MLGKTGQGKSTTGNKLINANGHDADRQAARDDFRVDWPVDAEHQQQPVVGIPSFEAAQGAQSVTRHCHVITNLATGYRVMDTRGFAPSDSESAANEANLSIIREVVGVSTDIGLAYHRVLYFLPYRDIPERADKYWQDELAVLWHFFGDNVFQNMVIVLTKRARSNPRAARRRPTANIDDEFGEGAREELQEFFEEALREAIGRREGFEARRPYFPPTVFISSNAAAEDVAEVIRSVNVREPHGINLRFRKSTCCS